MASHQETPSVGERPAATEQKRPVLPARDVTALAGSLVFLALGFAAIYGVRQVADVKEGVVLASLLIVPALLYLLLSGRVSELKGPGGLEVRLSEVANQTIPVPSVEQGGSSILSYEQVAAVEKGRSESFVHRIAGIMPEQPVVLTLKLGDAIDGGTAVDYAKGLTQFPRFRFVAVVDSEDKLICYMEERAFRHVIEADVVDSERLLRDIEQKNVGELRSYPGMAVSAVTPRTSMADALRDMQRLRMDALLVVTEDGSIKGLVERDRIANELLLSLIAHATE